MPTESENNRTHVLMSKIADVIHSSLRDLIKMHHVTAANEEERLQASYAVPFGALMGSVVMVLECSKPESWDDKMRKAIHEKVDQVVDGLVAIKKTSESTDDFSEKVSNVIEKAENGEDVREELYSLLGLKID